MGGKLKIQTINKEKGITEEYSTSNLDFIRHSYEEYANKDMNEQDYQELALKLTVAKYTGSRFDNLEWEVVVVNE